MAQLIRQDQLHIPDDPDDQLPGSEVSTIEADAADQEEFWNGLLSQLKRIIHGDEAGNWHDNPVTIFGSDASLRSLLISGAADRPFEVDFANELVVQVDHDRGARPLIQVLEPLGGAGWNAGNWNAAGLWNLSGSTYQKMDDPSVTHLSADVFQVTFSSPTTGKVIYF